jgi:hypothetical protein
MRFAIPLTPMQLRTGRWSLRVPVATGDYRVLAWFRTQLASQREQRTRFDVDGRFVRDIKLVTEFSLLTQIAFRFRVLKSPPGAAKYSYRIGELRAVA